VYATLLLALTQSALVTVAPGPADSCPAPAQVAAALEAHAPRLVVAQAEEDPAMRVTLVLSAPLATGEMSIFLLDKWGLVKLYRTLPVPTRAETRDCPALADTIALIVDRYFEEIGIPALPEQRSPISSPPPQTQAPPAPAPKIDLPRLALALDVGRRFPGGIEDMGGFELKLSAAVRVTRAQQPGDGLWIDLAAGFAGFANQPLKQGSATVVHTAGELSLLWGWATGRGRFYGGPATTLDLLWLASDSNGRSQYEEHLAVAAGLRIGYQHFWANHFFASADLSGHVAIRRYEVTAESDASRVIFANPSAFATLSLGVGFWF